VIHMLQNSDLLSRVSFLVGSAESVERLDETPARIPFCDEIVEFLNEVSRELMNNRAARAYSDVVTFAFWIRKASVLKLKERLEKKDGYIHMGKGVVFHIAPSNVPVNFAYSLVAGLLNGNANIVRVPSKEFEQVDIIASAFISVINRFDGEKQYIQLVRYGRDKDINDLFSSIADVRVIWGGDQTISELRKSPLPPRSGEITFADRYSIALIDSDAYLAMKDKKRVAEDFYNDTFFTDQNACTSPRVIIWTGNHKEEAKRVFWEEEHALVEKKYTFQPIQAVNKYTTSCLVACTDAGAKIEKRTDNLIIRVNVSELNSWLMDYRDNSGYFYEYDCTDISELKLLCDDKRCQTIAYIGDNKAVVPLLQMGVKGIDRVVPIGRTMDFDLIWDGYNLPALLTRMIVME